MRHRQLLQTKLLSGQCKPNKQLGRLPLIAAEITACRPLCRHNIIRRHWARFLAKVAAREHRAAFEAVGQHGNSPSCSEAANRRLQLHADLPHRLAGQPYAPAHLAADITNAHSEISRRYVRAVLVAAAASPTASPADKLNLIYFDLFYTVATRTVILADGRLIVVYQYRALDQGDGMANYFFNLAFAHCLAQFVMPYFSLASFVCLHDDTTIVAPIAVSAADVAAGLAEPRPLTLATPDDPDVYPYLAAVVDALATALRDQLDLELEVTKLHLFHPSTAGLPSLAVTLASLFPSGTVVEPEFYVVGGLPVGTPAGVDSFLEDLITAYEAKLERIVSIPGVHSHVAALILLNALKPNSLFNHHLRGVPSSLTLPYGHRLRRSIATAFARALKIDAAPLLQSAPTTASAFQLHAAPSAGGVGLSDPVTLAVPASLASLADTIPSLSSDRFLAPYLAATSAWSSLPSPTLRDAAASFPAITALRPLRLRLATLASDSATALSEILDAHGQPASATPPASASRARSTPPSPPPPATTSSPPSANSPAPASTPAPPPAPPPSSPPPASPPAISSPTPTSPTSSPPSASHCPSLPTRPPSSATAADDARTPPRPSPWSAPTP